jgi:carboxyl-terminal processing protease
VDEDMTDRVRNLLTITLIFVLAASAFVAGYFANDFAELRYGDDARLGERQQFSLFWDAWDRVRSNFLGELPDATQMTYGAIRGVLSSLNDPYTVFVEPVAREQERQSLQGTFGGIGAYLRRPEDGGPIMLEPIPGNPAEVAGILVDDVLVAVDGIEIRPDMSVSDVANLIRGEKGTTVKLTVLHPGNEQSIEIEVERDDILIPSVSYRILGEENTIGYIQLTRFSGESGNEVETAITDLLEQGAQGMILDLRDNGGGLLPAAVDVSDFFLSDGPILYQQSRDEGERVFEANEETLLPDMPLVVLINQNSASASEIVAGALQDRQRATLIGTHSFGKGSVQLVFDLDDGSSVHVTWARWYTPNRQQIDQNGVQPDIPVTITQEAIENGRDEVLARAIEFLQEGS